MWKWIALVVGVSFLTIFVIKIIKAMLKTEKESKQPAITDEPKVASEYTPQDAPIDMRSSSNNIVTDMSTKPSTDDYDMGAVSDSGFADFADDEFMDYSAHMKSSKASRRPPIDFDLEGDLADELEYMPSSPEFSYLNNRRSNKKQPLNKELDELSTEMKVLMLSDIFDRKFFD